MAEETLDSTPLPHRWKILIVVSLVLVTADQLSKFWAVKALTPGLTQAAAAKGGPADAERGLFEDLALFYGSVREPCSRSACREIVVIDGFWTYHYAENRGAAWSMLANLPDALRLPFFLLTTVGAIGFILWYFRKVPRDKKLLASALVLIFGGAIGNLIDRMYLGYVIDFIHWYAGDYHWPTFNVADSAITSGAVLLLLDVLFSKEKKPAKEKMARASSS
jgi:signal peptidase II